MAPLLHAYAAMLYIDDMSNTTTEWQQTHPNVILASDKCSYCGNTDDLVVRPMRDHNVGYITRVVECASCRESCAVRYVEPQTLEEARDMLEAAIAICNDDVHEEVFTLGMLIANVRLIAKEISEGNA